MAAIKIKVIWPIIGQYPIRYKEKCESAVKSDKRDEEEKRNGKV
jgi:hypothetical protein